MACKLAAAVVDCRSAGSGGTRRALTGWFLAHEMIVVGASSTGGAAAAAATGDGGGAEAMAGLGRTMAWTLRRLRG